MKSSPDYGDRTLYYDITDRGVVLEIDYGKQQGRILGKIPWDPDSSLVFRQGWICNTHRENAL